jgi:hypothetical protein
LRDFRSQPPKRRERDKRLVAGTQDLRDFLVKTQELLGAHRGEPKPNAMEDTRASNAERLARAKHLRAQGDIAYIVDSKFPERRDWRVDFSQPSLQQTEDFAILSRIFDSSTQAPVLVIAGIGSNGTKAAGEYCLSVARLTELSRIAPRGWEKMNFEVVLKVQVVQGHLGASQIVASDFW